MREKGRGSPDMRDPELPANPGRVELGRTPDRYGPGVRPSHNPGKRRSAGPSMPTPEGRAPMMTVE